MNSALSYMDVVATDDCLQILRIRWDRPDESHSSGKIQVEEHRR